MFAPGENGSSGLMHRMAPMINTPEGSNHPAHQQQQQQLQPPLVQQSQAGCCHTMGSRAQAILDRVPPCTSKIFKIKLEIRPFDISGSHDSKTSLAIIEITGPSKPVF